MLNNEYNDIKDLIKQCPQGARISFNDDYEDGYVGYSTTRHHKPEQLNNCTYMFTAVNDDNILMLYQLAQELHFTLVFNNNKTAVFEYNEQTEVKLDDFTIKQLLVENVKIMVNNGCDCPQHVWEKNARILPLNHYSIDDICEIMDDYLGEQQLYCLQAMHPDWASLK